MFLLINKILGGFMKKGFTLIELLAVIIILAVIALIATPVVLNVVDNAKKQANKDSVYGLLDAANLYYSESLLDDTIVLDGTTNLINELSISGKKPDSGSIYINESGEISIAVVYDNICYTKSFIDNDITESDNINDCVSNNELDSNNDQVVIIDKDVYGVKRALTSDSTSWERLEGAIGLVANAQIGTEEVQNDFDNIYPWSDIISYNYDTTTNQITAYYGDDNFKFDGTNGEVLTKIPEFYYKRYQDDTYEYVYISKIAKEGYSKSEEFSIGRYTMSYNSSTPTVYSKSGGITLAQNYGEKTITDFRTTARNLGTGFGIMDYHYFLIQLLYLVEYADYNSQAKLGSGATELYNSNNTAIGYQILSTRTSGECDFLGMKSGSVDGSGTKSVIYRGIEDIYGYVDQYVDGINLQGNQAYICYDQTQYAVDTFTGCYQKLGYVNGDTPGFASKLGYDSANPLVAFPIEVSESGGISDYYYTYNSGNGVAAVGDLYFNYWRAGLWSWYFDEIVGINVDARLIKIN
jgi:prepilin-type N-terminal cleavage/methylation domain-containing protein